MAMPTTLGTRSDEPTEDRSFEGLVLPHFDLVYRLAYKLTGDVHEAEDLVQEVFLKARRSFGGFELRDYGAKPWLLKIMHNAYLTRRGVAGRGPTLLDDLSLNDFAADFEPQTLDSLAPGRLNWDLFDEELKHAVEKLAPEYRMVLLLWALGDMSYKEIAQVLGIAIGTVMSRLFRARRQLATALTEYAANRGIRPVER